MRTINKIIVHCTATPEGRYVDVDDIKTWHKHKGFATIGYHWVVYLDGSVHKGRPEHVAGAHVAGHNADSIGIAYVGGCDKNMKPKDTRTPEQKDSLVRLLMDKVIQYPEAKIDGHNDYDKGKACPSFNAREEYKHI